MASSNDRLTATFDSTNPNVARVSANRTTGATTLAADNLAGWPTISKVHFSTYQVNTSNAVVPGTQRDWTGIKSGNNLTNLVLRAGGADNGNFINDIVEMNPTASWAQDLYTWGNKEHDLQGNHTNITPNQVSTDTILEKTSGNGVTIDGLSVKDGTLNTDSAVTANSIGASAITLGYSQITSTVNGTNGDANTGLTSTVTIPTSGRRVKITVHSPAFFNIGASGGNILLKLWDGAVGTGTLIRQVESSLSPATGTPGVLVWVGSPAAGSKTYSVSVSSNSPNVTANFQASSVSPAFMLVEAI